jgi:hypothetical protein
VIDGASKPPRLFPNPGQFWPAAAFSPNAVCVHFVAGYNNDTAIAAALEALSPAIAPATSAANVTPQEIALRQADIPQRIVLAIEVLTAFYYEHRDEPNTDVSKALERLLWTERVLDLDTTRQ